VSLRTSCVTVTPSAISSALPSSKAAMLRIGPVQANPKPIIAPDTPIAAVLPTLELIIWKTDRKNRTTGFCPNCWLDLPEAPNSGKDCEQHLTQERRRELHKTRREGFAQNSLVAPWQSRGCTNSSTNAAQQYRAPRHSSKALRSRIKIDSVDLLNNRGALYDRMPLPISNRQTHIPH